MRKPVYGSASTLAESKSEKNMVLEASYRLTIRSKRFNLLGYPTASSSKTIIQDKTF